MSSTTGPVLAVLCDVGPSHGVGHLMRCVALAEEFAARGHRVVFVSEADEVPFAARQLSSRGFASVTPEPPYAAQLAALGATTVVIDSYHLPASAYAEVSAAFPTVALVDGDPAGRVAHTYVDQNLGAEHDTWDLPAGAVRLAGLEYALLRDEILEQRPSGGEHAESDPLRVFAFFGGTDAFGAGPVLARALVATGRPFEATVVAPASWEVPATGPGQSLSLIGPTDDLAARVRAADLVVSAAGTSSWELLCLRAACGFVCVAENQRVSYGRVVETGAVVGLGVLDDVREDPAEAVAALDRLLTDAGLRRGLREAGGNLVDGLGRKRVADAALVDSGSA
ncbi:MAG: spore coat protein [Nocardioidaceae bacterium]|nr:spore coat protein [Nocardioidaceae bacterium]